MSYAEPICWADRPVRRVSRGLALGVLVAPHLFAWVLLRAGYSPRARMLGFYWLAVRLVGELTLLSQLGWTLDGVIGRLR